MKTPFFIILFIFLFISPLFANPLPVDPHADMPFEELNIVIENTSGTLHASVCGEYTFSYIDPEVTMFTFPVPYDTKNIHVWEESLEIPWEWLTETYYTWIPEGEILNIPKFKWEGPFPTTGTLFLVEYEYDLIRRHYYIEHDSFENDYYCYFFLVPPDIKEYIFIYPFSTGTFSQIVTEAEIDILIPDDYLVSDVLMIDSISCAPVSYQIVGHHLLISLDFVPYATLYVSLAEKGTDAKPFWDQYE